MQMREWLDLEARAIFMGGGGGAQSFRQPLSGKCANSSFLRPNDKSPNLYQVVTDNSQFLPRKDHIVPRCSDLSKSCSDLMSSDPGARASLPA